MSDPLLVTGGSGRLGRRVIELLLERGARVIATTRTPADLTDLAVQGVEVRHADHGDPATLRDAFCGARRMLVISSFSIGQRAEQMAHVVAAAKTVGVEHICYTSGVGARPGPDPVTADHFWSEQVIIASGLGWTMLRHNMYAEHVPLTLAIGVADGCLRSPIGTAGRGYVTREDCARADAGALTDTDPSCRIVDVSGPVVVSHADLAAIAGRLTGRAVAYQAVDRDAAVRAWTARGVPQAVAVMSADFDLVAAEGHHALATSAVERLGGRPPETIEAFLTRNPDLLTLGSSPRAQIDALLEL